MLRGTNVITANGLLPAAVAMPERQCAMLFRDGAIVARTLADFSLAHALVRQAIETRYPASGSPLETRVKLRVLRVPQKP